MLPALFWLGSEGSLRTNKFGLGSGLRSVSRKCSILVVLISFGGATGAQTPEGTQASSRPRTRLMEGGYVNLSALHQRGEHLLMQRLSEPRYDETAVFDIHHAAAAPVAWDAALGLRLWSNLSVGLGATYIRNRNGIDVLGAVPHPLVFDRHREVRLQPGGFDRTDIGVHLQAAWTVRMADRLDLALSAGPSLFRVELDRVSRIDVSEVRPPYEVVQTEISRAFVRKDLPGVNVGVDLTYHLVRSLQPGAIFWTTGLGVFVRWTMGTSALAEFGPDETIEVGGLQSGVGLRFRF